MSQRSFGKRHTPRITLVTPSYNYGQYLEACIDSILSQDYPNLEFIIMDGGSRDDSVRIIKKYERHLAYWQSRPDGGNYSAIEEGFRRSRGEIMAWLNADDMFHPGAFELAADVFSSDPEVEWLTGRPNSFDEQGRRKHVSSILPLNSRSKYLDGHDFIQQEGTFWRRALWERSGGYLEKEFRLAADQELWARFFRSARLFPVDALIAGFRDHPLQKSKDKAGYTAEANLILARERKLFAAEAKPFSPPAPLPILVGEAREKARSRREKTPTVSAIVSTYNAERFMRGRLEDLEAQTIADELEIVVVDSGSRQNERAIVEEFQRRYGNIRYIRTERRETVYQAWNRGIREARGEFVTNANTDDRLRRDCYETLVRALRERPECVLAYPDMRITLQENVTFEGHQPYGFRDWPEFDRLFLLEICCVGPFPLWRRSLHDEIGYFDERYRSAADYEFWLRAALKHDFVHVPEFLGLYWMSEETVSRKGDLPTLEYLQVQKEYRRRYAELAPEPETLSPGEEKAYRELLAQAAQGSLEALAGLDDFAKLHPRCARVHHDLGELYFEKGEEGYAKKHFEKAAIADPASLRYREKLQAFLRIELYQALQQYTAKAVADRRDLDAHLTLGMICILLERLDAARSHYRQALEIDPENVLALENLASLDQAILTSIIVAVGNEIDYTRECLESIERNTPEPHEVILAGDGCSEETLAWLRDFCAGKSRYTFAGNGNEPGLAGACNIGMRRARGGRIVLLANDVVVTEGWLAGMLECLEREGGTAVVGPMTAQIAGAQRVAGTGYGNLAQLEEYAREFRASNAGRRLPVERLAGSCMLFSKGFLDAVGQLDPRFGFGNFEDDDFCLRASLAGYRCVIAGDVFIHHYGSRSFTGRGGECALRNRETLAEKWDLQRLDEETARKVATRHALVQGSRLARRGELNAAVDLLLQQGIACSPANPDPYILIAELFADAGRHETALEVLAGMPPGEEVSFLIRGECLNALERHAEAQELAQRALQREESARALYLGGIVAAARDEKSAAEGLFRRAMESDPGFGAPCTGLAALLWERGEREEALRLAERGFVLAPLSTGALDRFHRYATECGNLETEERRVREARAIHPDHKGLAYGLIEVLLRRRSFAEAMREVQRAAVDFGLDDGGIDAALEVRRFAGEPAPVERGSCSVSLCMIVKNEARHLPAALLSVQGFADEIVVVDTGSSDRTADIARIFGARVSFFPWNGSFSDARNFSLSEAQGDWILILDADEVLSPGDLPPLASLLQRTGEPTAYSFVTRNYTEEITRKNWSPNGGEYPAEERGRGWTPSEKVRLFPNDDRVRFRGAVHELLETSLVEAGIRIHACDVPVHHYGKLDAQKCAEKQESYYLLGMKKLAETGGSVESVTELARQATELKRTREAEGLWQRVLEASPGNAEAYFNLGYLYLAEGDYGRARVHAGRGAELAPDMKEAAFNLGKSELYTGNPLQALARCEEMLGRWPDYPPAMSLHAAALLALGSAREAEEVLERLRRMGFDCCDFLMEYAEGLKKGERGDLAAPLLAAAGSLGAVIPGQGPERRERCDAI